MLTVKIRAWASARAPLYKTLIITHNKHIKNINMLNI